MWSRLVSRYVFFVLIAIAAGHACGQEQQILATRVANNLNRPVFAVSPPGDTDRLFIAEQHTGAIRILDLNTGQLNATAFLDMSGLSTGNEQGLLGLAFHPDYAQNGQFYVNATLGSQTNIRRYTVSSDNSNVADPASAQTVLQYSQPQANHNGGWMDFGPDGFLYIASGDGGAANDSGSGHTSVTGNAQDTTGNLLGKILRIDVNGDDFASTTQNYALPPTNPFVDKSGDDEIWAYGLRNPWRASFDRATGDLYIGDVGQDSYEEVDFQPANSQGGENYGWRLREGTQSTPTGGVGGAKPPGAIDPIHEYSHAGAPDGGFSITGGYMYRGPIESLQGNYFFADYVTDQIWSFEYDGTTKSNFQNRTSQIVPDQGSIGGVSSFGEDDDGNLYIVSLDGDVWRIDDVIDVQTILPAGSVWSYLDDGSNQGTAWREPDFNDASWASGPAQLGYGDGDEATEVSYGSNANQKYATTYFRHQFDLDNADLVETLTLGLVRDDGAAVYLNGTEVARDNLAANATSSSFATATVSQAEEGNFFQFNVDASILQEGENTLAVEIHQRAGNSSDISFDLRLLSTFVDTLTGDIDLDGDLDTDDLNLLCSTVHDGSVTRARFDRNQDGQFDAEDVAHLVENEFDTQVGDVNVDGVIDEQDLSQRILFQSDTQYTSWDLNCDGLTDVRDVNFYLDHRPTERGAGSEAVPEPRSSVVLALVLGVIGLRRRRP